MRPYSHEPSVFISIAVPSGIVGAVVLLYFAFIVFLYMFCDLSTAIVVSSSVSSGIILGLITTSSSSNTFLLSAITGLTPSPYSSFIFCPSSYIRPYLPTHAATFPAAVPLSLKKNEAQSAKSVFNASTYST